MAAGKAVVHHAHAEHGKVVRQRLPHGLLDAAPPHGRGEAGNRAPPYSLVQPTASAEANDISGCGLKPCEKATGRPVVERALKKALQIKMRYKAQARVFAKAQKRSHRQAPS